MLESDTSSKAEATVMPISWGRAGFHKVMHVKPHDPQYDIQQMTATVLILLAFTPITV